MSELRLYPAKVTALTYPTLQVLNLSTGRTVNGVVRPTISGLTTGYHWLPNIGDRLILTYWAGTPMALCGLSAWGQLLASLPTGQPDEQFLYGPTGNVLRAIQSGAVEAGNPADPFKAVVLDGDAITGSITAPSGGGACSFSLTAQASAVVLKGN